MPGQITVKGARVHNLKNIDLEIPRDNFVVITGVSGSGKSSLAFDTIYAEGQRRYVESLSAYARQFLEQMERPDVDSIEGLSPAISIEERAKDYFRRHYDTIDVDGVRVQFPEGWGLIRASNTQPALVLRFEAKTPAKLKEYRGIIEKKLKELQKS